MKAFKGIVVGGLMGAWAIGCSAPTDEVGSTGLAIEVDLDESVEANGLRYSVSQVDCSSGDAMANPFKIVRDRDVELPAVHPGAGGPSGRRPMGDQYVVVPAGCYDITVEVLADQGPPLACGPAIARNVAVVDGETTEILLALQCQGAAMGGLDVTATTNNPPVIENLEFSPSKFLFECEAVNVCATVRDMDGDEIDFGWSTETLLYRDITVLSTTRLPGNSQMPGAVQQCVEIVNKEAGDIELRLAVWDLFTIGSEVRRAEEWFADNGQLVSSRDSLDFPLHVGTDIDLLCITPTGALEHVPGVRDFDRVEGCDFVTPEEQFCSELVEGHEVTCPDGVFDPSTVYQACPDGLI